MTFQIIIKGKGKHHNFGKTRSEQEENMRKEWGHTMTDEQLDKLKFHEKRTKEKTGQDKGFLPGHVIEKIK